MISCLILTLNEESNIADCVESIPWRSDVHVLDSFSTDSTVAIAKGMDARIHQRSFRDYADQRNFGLSLPFANEWILMLDADERVTPGLAREIERIVSSGDQNLSMLLVRRKDIFLGRWLRRSSGYPTWFPRLLRRGRVSVFREINEQYKAQGRTGRLSEHLLHFPFKKGVSWWFNRHNRYSSMESVAVTAEYSKPVKLLELFVRDPTRRRACIKRLAYRIPFRPFLVFFYLYVLRMGFMDGQPGYLFAQMRMSYEIMIDAKILERRFADREEM
jgi:glycosyltransferase involved in cell wall biosynthesis